MFGEQLFEAFPQRRNEGPRRNRKMGEDVECDCLERIGELLPRIADDLWLLQVDDRFYRQFLGLYFKLYCYFR